MSALHAAATPGSASERRINEDYVHRIADDAQPQRSFKVVVGAGNGVARAGGRAWAQACAAQAGVPAL